MIEQQIEEIEVSIAAAKSQVAKMDALLRLTENKDFKEIIDDGYFIKEASRVVLLKADPEMQDAKFQKQLDDSIIAIGVLRQYFRSVIQLGRMAQRSIEDDEKTREELLAEAV